MKQLIDNPSRISCERGWLLLSLCLSSFEPSPEFATHVREFISEAPIRDTLLERFEQCAQKGTRRQPPSYIEFQVSNNEYVFQKILGSKERKDIVCRQYYVYGRSGQDNTGKFINNSP